MSAQYLKALVQSFKTNLIFGIVLFSLAFVGAQIAVAADNPVKIDQYTQSVAQKSGYVTAGVTDKSLSQSIGRVIKFVLSMVGLIFLVLTFYAGILWMTAGGNSEQVEKAQDIMKTAVVGLIIVIGCYGIVTFVIAAVSAVSSGQNVVGG